TTAGNLPSTRTTPLPKLQEQDERAERLKGRLRWEQRELRVRPGSYRDMETWQPQGHGDLAATGTWRPGSHRDMETWQPQGHGDLAATGTWRPGSHRDMETWQPQGHGYLAATGTWRSHLTEDVEVDVESMVSECLDADGLGTVPHAGIDHCYSSSPDRAGL
ncbi:hypothetical protein J4Q44_G00309030, partial [Coregonus suidteri]